MKHFRKVCSVLLALLMVAVMLPTFIAIETPVEAAEPGAVVNGGFDTYESYTGSSGQTAWKAEGWTVRDWGITLGESGYSGKGARISKDSSHKDSCELTQVVPVNTNATYTFSFYAKAAQTNCAYTACFTYSLDLGNDAGSCTNALVTKATVTCTGSGWQQFTYTVPTGSYKYLQIRFFATGVGSGDSYLDSVALTTVNAGDTGTHAAPTLKSFATEKNRPSSSSDNVIVQPGFESTTNAQWNTSDFLKQGVQHVTGDSEGAHSGSAYLKYYHGTVAYTEWPMFEITCPTAGEYVFSAWVRTPHLSANNQGTASIGIIDRDTNKFLTYSKPDEDDNSKDAYYGHFSTPEIQIRSTATDDDWHLRSVTFYVGAANSNIKIGMYGLKSTMYVDDISVHLLSKGVTYSGDQKGTLSASKSSTNYYCEAEDNLIVDCNMNTSNAVDFWSKASGWNNGFLEFNKDGQDASHGKVLHYKTTNPDSKKKYRYVKFVYVEPNTSYTVSFDYRIVSAGNNLTFIDNNVEKNAVFHTPSLGSASNSWKTYTFTFNSGNYNRIGIVFQDGNGEAYYDDFRFFKTDDKTTTEPEEETPVVEGAADLTPYKTGTSRMEMDASISGQQAGKLGLAFRFNLECDGVTYNTQFVGDYSNGTVKPFDGKEDTYKLVTAGAVMTNKESVGTDKDAFKLNNATASDGVSQVINVPAEKLFATYHKEYHGDPEDGIVYAIRIKNIPESHIGTMIYARPYYIYETEDGEQITIYGEIVCDAYEKIPDINDGWLEWD